MNTKSIEKLEFNKVREMLSQMALLEVNKKKAMSLMPFSTKEEADKALSEVSSGTSLILKRSNPPIYEIGEIEDIRKRLEIGGSLNTKELLNIAKILKTAEELKKYAEEEDKLSFYFDALIPLSNIKNEIDKKIISEEEISDNASIKLYTVRKKINSSHDKIRDILNKYISSSVYQKYLQDNIVTMRGDRFVLPVKAEHKGDIPGIVHDTSASGGTVFIEPMPAVEANNALKELFIEEEKEIERILYDLSNMCMLCLDEILSDYTTICELDFIFAKAKLALKLNATKPIINNRGYINLKKARHPLIDSKNVVPIDVSLGGEYKTLIITGPNTGGKTVSLKTVGLLSLMGLSGLFIPANDLSEIGMFSEIYADIGDEQSISQSLSTFSSHMKNIVEIVKNADEKSLILLDELGAGTDPTEGASLAIGIIEHLGKSGARQMVTTHYSELKLYALSTKGVMNAGCEFDVETLKPTYRLLVGIPGKSNAFAISKKLGLSEEILEASRKHLNEDNIKFEDVLSEIEKTRIMLKKERELTADFKEEAENLRAKLKKQEEKSKERYNEIINKANEEAKEILEEAKEDASGIIKELRSIRKNENQRDFDRKISGATGHISDKIKKRRDAIKKQTATEYKRADIKDLIPGTNVILIEQGSNAVVSEKPDKDGNVTVSAGILKIRTKVSNIALDLSEKKKETTYQTRKRMEFQSKSMPTEINIIGKTTIDGVMEAEKFIDDAVMLHMDKLSIIHGKGTGVLRGAIHEMLKRHPQVKSYRLGTFGEGETGVTIVELK